MGAYLDEYNGQKILTGQIDACFGLVGLFNTFPYWDLP